MARGLLKRFPDGVPEEHRARAEFEVSVMCQMGFPGYFLVVADLVRHAHDRGIRVGQDVVRQPALLSLMHLR